MRARVRAAGRAPSGKKNPAIYWRENDTSVALMEIKLPMGPEWTAQLDDRSAYK
jgi:hypothetical protein